MKGNNKTYESVRECLKETNVPLRAKDIVSMVEKSRYSIFRELKWLSKVREIEKVVICENEGRLIITGYVKKKERNI